MATSSIFNNIQIKDEASCRSFLDAVESSEKASSKIEPPKVEVKELKTKEEIADFLNK